MCPCKQSAVLIYLLLGMPMAIAGEAYTWIDSKGVTHFSELPPADKTADATHIDLPPALLTPTLPADRYDQIVNQAARMEASRLQREKERTERRQAEAERQQARIEAEAAAQYELQQYDHPTRYYYPYPYWYGMQPWQHHRRHEHQPPPPRPRFVPGRTLTQKRNHENLRMQRYPW
jgi:hypothetical protein